jgi:hypothetical protein
VLTVNAGRSVTDLYRIRNEIADRVAALRANPGLCSGSTGGTCTCYGTGKKCFGPNGDWWYAGQYCNGAGDCVSYSCDVPY